MCAFECTFICSSVHLVTQSLLHTFLEFFCVDVRVWVYVHMLVRSFSHSVITSHIPWIFLCVDVRVWVRVHMLVRSFSHSLITNKQIITSWGTLCTTSEILGWFWSANWPFFINPLVDDSARLSLVANPLSTPDMKQGESSHTSVDEIESTQVVKSDDGILWSPNK